MLINITQGLVLIIKKVLEVIVKASTEMRMVMEILTIAITKAKMVVIMNSRVIRQEELITMAEEIAMTVLAIGEVTGVDLRTATIDLTTTEETGVELIVHVTKSAMMTMVFGMKIFVEEEIVMIDIVDGEKIGVEEETAIIFMDNG